MSNIEEKKVRLAEILTEARTLIGEIGTADSSDPYSDIQSPSSSGDMGSATGSPEVVQAIASIEAAEVEVSLFEMGAALIDHVRELGIF